MPNKQEKDAVKNALKDFESATAKLRKAYAPLDDGKNQDPHDVAVATSAPRVFVEEAKARLDAEITLAQAKNTQRSTCTMLVLTAVIMLAAIARAWSAYMNYALSKSANTTVCPKTN